MSDARNSILNSIRSALKREELDSSSNEQLIQKMTQNKENIIPKRVKCSADELLRLFIEQVEKSGATLCQVQYQEQVTRAVEDYINDNHLGSHIKIAPKLKRLDWGKLHVDAGAAVDADKISVNEALAGVAETGTLVCVSGPETPTTLNFLPEVAILLLDVTDIVGPYEQAWDRIHAQNPFPRTINFITGPSRTGDIEQKILLGIHGPKQLHIVLINPDKDPQCD